MWYTYPSDRPPFRPHPAESLEMQVGQFYLSLAKFWSSYILHTAYRIANCGFSALKPVGNDQ